MIRLWRYVRGVVGGWVRSITVNDDTDAALAITQSGSAEGLDSTGRIKATAVAAADDVIVAKGAASHTGDLFQGQDSGGAALFKIEKDGDINSLSAGGHKVAFCFMQSNVAASQGNIPIDVLGLAGNTEYCMPWDGSVIGISVMSNEARTGGTLEVEVTLNGAATGLKVGLDSTYTTRKATTQAKDTDVFGIWARLGVIITTSADWAPTTADIVVTVIVEL